MCRFLSFIVTRGDKPIQDRIFVGNLRSHVGVCIGWDIPYQDQRECEWRNDGSLVVLTEKCSKTFVFKNIDESVRYCNTESERVALKEEILEPFKDRDSLLEFITEGKSYVTTYRYRNGMLHSETKPAIDEPGYRQRWMQNNVLHREDGPAITIYYKNGEYHERWYKNNVQHRDDGPAVYFSCDKTEEWWRNGVLHREDGPAVIVPNKFQEWWENGKLIRKEQITSA